MRALTLWQPCVGMLGLWALHDSVDATLKAATLKADPEIFAKLNAKEWLHG